MIQSKDCVSMKMLRKTQSNDSDGDQGAVPLNVLLGQIVQKAAALTDHLVQAATAVVIVGMNLQVLGELIDPLGEDSHLNLGGSGVSGMGAVGLDNGGLLIFLHHGFVPPF